jgi:hypothetical protein
MNGSVADRCILTQQAGYNILNVRVEGRWQSKLPFDDLVTRFPFFVRHVQRGQVIAGGQLRKAVATFLFVSQPLQPHPAKRVAAARVEDTDARFGSHSRD